MAKKKDKIADAEYEVIDDVKPVVTGIDPSKVSATLTDAKKLKGVADFPELKVVPAEPLNLRVQLALIEEPFSLDGMVYSDKTHYLVVGEGHLYFAVPKPFFNHFFKVYAK